MNWAAAFVLIAGLTACAAPRAVVPFSTPVNSPVQLATTTTVPPRVTRTRVKPTAVISPASDSAPTVTIPPLDGATGPASNTPTVVAPLADQSAASTDLPTIVASLGGSPTDIPGSAASPTLASVAAPPTSIVLVVPTSTPLPTLTTTSAAGSPSIAVAAASPMVIPIVVIVTVIVDVAPQPSSVGATESPSVNVSPTATPEPPQSPTVTSIATNPPLPTPPPTNAPVVAHTYYLSSVSDATNYYCDTDPAWKTLSQKNLKQFPSAETALAAYPGRKLHRPC